MAVTAIKRTRLIAEQPALSDLIDHEIRPSKSVQSDEELLSFAKAAGTTVYHPVGSCRMGVGGTAVVDPQLRVHKTQGLRVIDASVMPRLISGNTNAATIMIAEKAADMIAKG
jgi:choline dehydrogenase